MVHTEEKLFEGCSPIGDTETAGCPICPPKMVLTPEEETILTQMRSIKAEVRAMADRLKELGTLMADPAQAGGENEVSEWRELSSALECLRAEWKEWVAKLDAAIETKLIMLGHRRPSTEG